MCRVSSPVSVEQLFKVEAALPTLYSYVPSTLFPEVSLTVDPCCGHVACNSVICRENRSSCRLSECRYALLRALTDACVL